MEKWKILVQRMRTFVKVKDLKESHLIKPEEPNCYKGKLREKLQLGPKVNSSKEVLETKEDNKLLSAKNLLLKIKEQGLERSNELFRSEHFKMIKYKKKEMSLKRVKRQALLTIVGVGVGSALYRFVKAPLRLMKNSLALGLLGVLYLQVKYYQKSLQFMRKTQKSSNAESFKKKVKYLSEKTDEIKKRWENLRK